ncbi:septum formation initiator family protein, partial [Streptomyces sp. E11-3]|uniref:FtsB family cell division protein n=1 Tax=Streptomyces sp. E11-3 TaxID=3110112 RepID=UPI00398119D2
MSGGQRPGGRVALLGRLLPTGPASAARMPFVLLVVMLLGGGLIALLVLNSSLNEGSFRLSDLKKKTTELTEEQQELQRDVDRYSAPGALERRARELGMVPGGNPAFLDPDGTVRGTPGGVRDRPSAVRQKPAAPPAAAPPAPSATPTPTASPSPAQPETP